MTASELHLTHLRARPVNVPIARPLQTGGGAVTSAAYVLVDLETDGGITGCAYVVCYTPRMLAPLARLLAELGALLAGDPVAPLAIEEKLQGTFRLLGAQGLAGMALSVIDMAAWDVCAKAAGLPLAVLLGGTLRPTPAYNSCGLGLMGAAAAGPEARELAAPGFRAVKVRLGYPEPADDVTVARAVREAVGPDVRLMSDYNQCLSVAEAQRRVAVLADALGVDGLYWVEEPTRFDDYAGHARIREKAALRIQLGENCWGPHDVAKALGAGACDYVMPDVGKVGGVTGWLRAVALAEPLDMPVSSHIYPEVSAHLLAVTPTRHYLEYMDWANPILRTPLAVRDGEALPTAEPGIGITWNEEAVAQYAVP